MKRACVSVVHIKCAVCDGECKNFSQCKQFLQMHQDARWEKIKQVGACFSCLKIGHQTSRCFARKRCQVENCQRSHHPLLHTTDAAAISTRRNVNTFRPNQTQPVQHNLGTTQCKTALYIRILPQMLIVMYNTDTTMSNMPRHNMMDVEAAMPIALTTTRFYFR